MSIISRRVPALLGLAAAVLATPLVLAAPAQAGVSPSLITVDLSGGECVLSSSAVTGNPGSAFTIHISDDCRLLGIDASGAPVSPSGVGGRGPGTSQTFTMTSLGSGGMVMAAGPDGGVTFEDRTLTVTVTDGYVPEPVIHDDLQQVGVPASGDCADVPASAGHYPGFPIGGWSKSWAWWINDGKGGEVCTRELEELPNGTVVLVG